MPDQTIKPLDETTAASPDIVAENIAKLRELFPECFTEGVDEDGPRFKVDFESLKETLGDYVENSEERYAFTWTGKAAARQVAQKQTAATLRPSRDKSIKWDSSRNVFIEGEALEVLKTLQKSYHRSVRLVFVDPPYNKGSDRFFPGQHKDSLETYLSLYSGDESARITLAENSSTAGQFHSRWLSAMYPRLVLGRHLLANDGYCVVCIDDNELHHLRMLMDLVYGEENRLATVAVDRTRKNDAHYFSVGHEYLLVYAKSKSFLRSSGVRLRATKHGVAELHELFVALRKEHKDDWVKIKASLNEYFEQIDDDDPRAPLKRFTKVDEHGPHRTDGDISWPGGGGPRYDVPHPVTKRPCKVPSRGWVWPSYERMKEEIDAGNVVFGDDETTIPSRRRNLFDADEQVMGTVAYSYSQTAVQDLAAQFGGVQLYEHPKDPKFLQRFVEYLTAPGDIVLDMYSRIGSLPHAVLLANQDASSPRRFICIQEPEGFDLSRPAGKNAEQYCIDNGLPRNMAALARQRLQLAGESLRLDEHSTQDIGFRTFRLDSSNIAAWNPTSSSATDELLLQAENVLSDRSPDDLLFELLLKFGLPLDTPVTRYELADCEVFVVGAGALVACLEGTVSEAVADEIVVIHSELQPAVMRVVFRDNAFPNDVVKTNAIQILAQAGVTDVRSI